MKSKTPLVSTIPKHRKSADILGAISVLHYGASSASAPKWALNARQQFISHFKFLSKYSEFFRRGFQQGMADAMIEAMRAESQKFRVESDEARELYATKERMPHELIDSTDTDKRDFYAGKVLATEKFSDGGLPPRIKCLFFMFKNHEYFDGLKQKEAHKVFVSLKFISQGADESQTRQWFGDIKFRSGMRGRPTKQKT